MSCAFPCSWPPGTRLWVKLRGLCRWPVAAWAFALCRRRDIEQLLQTHRPGAMSPYDRVCGGAPRYMNATAIQCWGHAWPALKDCTLSRPARWQLLHGTATNHTQLTGQTAGLLGSVQGGSVLHLDSFAPAFPAWSHTCWP